MYGYGNSMFLATHGILARTASGGGIDPDAQAFITAASITDPTQQSAINQLVVDLKGYGVWTKMKVIYPYVGGTSTSTSYNLKNPSQFQISWIGGVTWSNNGVLFGGVNGYGNTGYNLSVNNTANNISGGTYSRTNTVAAASFMGGLNASFDGLLITPKFTDNNTYYGTNDYIANGSGNFVTDTRGMFVVTRVNSSNKAIYRNGSQISTSGTTTNVSPNVNVFIGARNYNGIAQTFDNREHAFDYIGELLTGAEIGNLTTAVQAFQTTLGRSIGTQTVSDADAQAFVTNAGIVDQVEANAVNNLVIGLKADGLWTKMKACYPMVGGSSSTMKYNLVNPLDTDAAFRLIFNGGLTYSSTGLLGGVNGYADTKLAPSTSLSLNNTHISFYSRTDTSTGENVEMGVNDNSNNSRLFIAPKYDGATSAYRSVNSAQAGPQSSPDMKGFFIASRVNSSIMKLYKNSSILFTDGITSGVLNTSNIFLLCYNLTGTPYYYSDRECAFASIGDGLDDTEATNLNSRVTTFQTALNRNV